MKPTPIPSPYAPEHGDAFEELVRWLRRTEEWRHVDREVDIRLTRLSANGDVG